MELQTRAKHWNFYRALLVLVTLGISCTKAQKEICHPRPMDIVFVIDGSRSVRPWHFKSTKDAVKDMVDQFEEIGPNGIQIGLIQYGSIVKQEFALNSYETKEEIIEAIDAIEYMAAGTMTGSALRYLVSRTFQPSQGARTRPDVSKVAVIITDGRAQDSRAVVVWQKKVKSAGIEVFAIGVGRRIHDEDLLLMASEPKDSHKFYVKDFSLIQNLPLFLKKEVCVIEIDECELEVDNCTQICTNTIGSYFCSCEEDYALQEDGKTCLPIRPAYPVNLTLSDPTHTTMKAKWNLDDPSRAETVLHYVVTYEPSDGSGERREVTVTEPEALLEGLTPETEYRVSVKAVGKEMDSPTVSDTETTLSLGETSVTLSNHTMTSMTAKWEPAGGDLLSSYSVRVVKLGPNGEEELVEDASRELPSDVTSLDIKNLDPNQKYRVTVTPMHGKLPGGSGSAEGSTLNLAAPEVTVTDATFTTAVVEWTGIGVKADSFGVRLFPSDEVDGAETELFKEVPGDSMSVLFSGLKPGTEYTAVVVGYVDEEKEIISPEGSNDGTTKSPPTPEVEITDAGLSIMDAMWTVSGPTPDYFEYEYYPTGQPGNVQTGTTEDMSVRMKDLQPGTDYTINVVAVYEEGTELIKSKVGSTTGTTKVLHAPDVDALYETLTTGPVEWSGIGMEATSWRVEYFYDERDKKTAEPEGSSNSATMTELKPGVLYTVQVTGSVEEDGKTFESPVGEDTLIIEPIPPPKVDITSTGLTIASVQWTAEEAPGGVLPTAFDVIYFPTNAPQDKKKFTTEEPYSELTGLKQGTEYTVQVVAEYKDLHELGTTVKSPAGQDLDTTKTLPPPVVNISDITETTLDGNWIGELGVTGYIVQIDEENLDEGAPAELKSPSEEAKDLESLKDTFDSLSPGTTYALTVWSKVYEGDEEIVSPPGTAIGVTKPAPPENLAADEIYDGLLDLSFKRPPGNADSFEVKCVPEGADPEKVETITIDANDKLAAKCSDLAPGVLYAVMARTIYKGLKSDWVQVQETIRVGPVQNFELSEPTTHTLVATWEPPSNVDVVQLYRLVYRPADLDVPPVTVEVPGNVTRYVLQGLLPETLYVGKIVPIVRRVFGPESRDTETTLEDEVAIEVTDVSFNTISVEWPVSRVPNVQYILFWRIKPDPSQPSKDTPTQSKTFEDPNTSGTVIMEVLPATEYDIKIRYVYSAGDPGEAETFATTLAPPPGPPIFSAVAETDFIVQWEAPGFGAMPIGYDVAFFYLNDEGLPLDEVIMMNDPAVRQLKYDGVLPGTLVNVTIVARYQYNLRSNPSKGQVTTLEPEELCSCRTYLSKQREMQRSLQSLVDVITALNTKIESLENKVLQPSTCQPVLESGAPEEEGSAVEEGFMVEPIPPEEPPLRSILRP